MLRARLSGWANVYVGLASKNSLVREPLLSRLFRLARNSETVYTRHANDQAVGGVMGQRSLGQWPQVRRFASRAVRTTRAPTDRSVLLLPCSRVTPLAELGASRLARLSPRI